MKFEKRMTEFPADQLADAFNNVPCGLCVYRVSRDRLIPLLHNPAFYELMGFMPEHVTSVEKETRFLGVHPEDLPVLWEQVWNTVKTGTPLEYEYRQWNDKRGEYRWIHVTGAVHGQQEEELLLYNVYSDITEQVMTDQRLQSTNKRLQDIVNAIPGGIAIYRISPQAFETLYFSEGVCALTGYTVEEYRSLAGKNALRMIYAEDIPLVREKAGEILKNHGSVEFEFRNPHKDGRLIWVRIHATYMGEENGSPLLHCVFHNITDLKETLLEMDHLVNSLPGGIVSYWIENDRIVPTYYSEGIIAATGYSREDFERLTGGDALNTVYEGDKEQVLAAMKQALNTGEVLDISYRIRHKEGHLIWVHMNGRRMDSVAEGCHFYAVVTDISNEISARQEKKRMEEYFQTILQYLPGGVVVIRYDREKETWVPEFMSEGFAAMSGMSVEEVRAFYHGDAMTGMYPEDISRLEKTLEECTAEKGRQVEMTYRLRRGKNGYFWVKAMFTFVRNEDGQHRIYAMYHDMTKELAERERLRQQYSELLVRHYHKIGPDVILAGHCNVTGNVILEIIDYTQATLHHQVGGPREDFIRELAGMVENPAEREKFRALFSGGALLAAYRKGKTEVEQECFLRLEGEDRGRYVRIKINLVEDPDSGGLTSILTITDVTRSAVEEIIFRQLSTTGYDLVADVDLFSDHYQYISGSMKEMTKEQAGCYSNYLEEKFLAGVLPRDRSYVRQMMDPSTILEKLGQQDSYSFSYTLMQENGEHLTKKTTISAVDLRIGHVCISRSDITDSVREQQRLLNIIAYTFDLVTLIDVEKDSALLYTRQMVLDGLGPYQISHYRQSLKRMAGYSISEEGGEDSRKYFALENVLKQLEEKPAGYDFVLPYMTEKLEQRYKQINVMWGDREHRTVCMVRADVTEMLSEERRSQRALEEALDAARQANRAKSDFLSSMSHDIRTPMNAIMGMTTLAEANLSNPEKVSEYLGKITSSSGHLLSLINNILDMNKIEQSRLILRMEDIYLPGGYSSAFG